VTLPTLTLKKRGHERVRAGHHWIFSNELTHIPTTLAAGSLVKVQDEKERSYGTALFNPHTLVAARLLKASVETLDTTFFAQRIAHSFQFRQRLFPAETAYRLVFGESDLLPGLIIDRYGTPDGDYFALQTLAAGMDIRVGMIIDALREVFPTTRAIVEKNNSGLRALEGLELRESVLWQAQEELPDSVEMPENGLRFAVSLLHGQKTGYFLDQKLNRKRIQELTGGMRVLDCFTNQGGFALNAAKGGAVRVLGLDSSSSAIERCRANARLNSMDRVAQFETQEVFEFLQNETASAMQSDSHAGDDTSWDCIILDPPAFTKSRKHIPVAKRGYAKINRMALKLLPSGGLLATGSCSHHISEEMFLNIVQEQAFLERRELRLMFHGTQSPCHPILVGMPETRYLKFFIFEVQ
jgi:23S rRNA (cytosine1962-C5)-methyltransferase